MINIVRQLIIHNVQIEDEDKYQVRIHNEFGEVTRKAKLACLSKLNFFSWIYF